MALTTDASIALIGCGRWGRNVARALSRLNGLAVIVDERPDLVAPFAAELGVPVVDDLASVLERPDIKGVAVATPAVTHAAVVRKALSSGKHVYVEKPLAMTVEDAESCAAAASSADRLLMVGHLLQYHPAFVRLLEVVEQGEIGELRHVVSNRLNPGAIRSEEDALWSLAPHDFSMVARLGGGKPTWLQALATRVVDPATPDAYSVLMKFGDRLTAQINVSWLSPFKEHKLTVLGTKGAIIFEDTASDPARKLVIYREYIDRSGPEARFAKGPGEPVAYPQDEPLLNEMRSFMGAMTDRSLCRTDPGEAIPVLELLQQATAASRM